MNLLTGLSINELTKRLVITRLTAGLLVLSAGISQAPAAPDITQISLLPSKQIQLDLTVEAGKSYTFEVSTNLVQWMPVGGITDAPTNRLSVVDEDRADLSPARFYRMREGRYTRFSFGLMHFADGGQFAGTAVSPVVNFPVFFRDYSAMLDAEGDAPYPAPSQVFFTGPPGSGLNGTTASQENSGSQDDGAWYQSPNVASATGAPTGTWTVNYRGTNMTYQTSLQALTRLVVPVPTVVLSGGNVQSVSWIYRDRLSGVVLGTAPGYMRNIQVQLEGIMGRMYDSPYGMAPTETTHLLTQQIAWAEVRAVFMGYDDMEGNHFVLFFNKQ